MRRPTKPDIGHLVRSRASVGIDIIDTATALVVSKRGIDVQVLLPCNKFSWVRRDMVEVIDGSCV